MRTPSFKAQAIIDGDKAWPYIGNAFSNKDGSISLLLDRGVKLVLPSGDTLEADGKTRVKVFLRAPRVKSGSPDAAQPVAEPVKAMSGVHIW